MPRKNFSNVGIFLLLVGPVLLLSIFSYFQVRSDLTQTVLLRRESVASLASLLVQERLDRTIDVGITFADIIESKRYLETDQWGSAATALEELQAEYAYIDRITFFDDDGILQAATKMNPEIQSVVGHDFSYRDYYEGVIKTEAPYVGEVIVPAVPLGYNLVPIAIPVRSSSNEFIGFLLLSVKLDTVLTWIKDLDTGSGIIYVTDHKGTLVAHPVLTSEELIDFSSVEAVQKALSGEEGVEVLYNSVEDVERLSAYTQIPGYNWAIVYAEETGSAFAQREEVLRMILIIFGMMNVLVIIAAYWIVQNRARIQEANKQLSEMDKQKSEFISIASHQLRTPLGSIRWILEMLLSKESMSAQDKADLHEAYLSNLRVIRLVGDLLNVARIEQGRVVNEPELTDLTAVIESAVKEMEPEAMERSITLSFVKGKIAIPKIMIDPRRFREVIQNLLTNAVKYTLKKGKVTVTISAPKQKIEISVADTGIGIPDKDKGKLFAKFARAENAISVDTGGTGLGLYIVKSFVESWGGKISFKSQLKKGTVFTISLPKK